MYKRGNISDWSTDLVQIYPNGGGKVLHSWQEDLDKLNEEENLAFAEEFVTESFRNGFHSVLLEMLRLENET